GLEARTAAARRLLVVVADPGMRLPDLTSELAAMAGVAGNEEAEGRLRSAFMSLVEPGAGAFRSITNALAASLLLYITLGVPAAHGSGSAAAASGSASHGVAAPASMVLLGRVGASGLAADVAALGEQLLMLCAVNEAVHGDLYEEMYVQVAEQEAAASQEASALQLQQQRRQQQQQQQAAAVAVAAGLADGSRSGEQPVSAAAAQGAGQLPAAASGEGPRAPQGDVKRNSGRAEEERLQEGDEI
ncbi:hypothetical protein Vretimale_16492, partial [Volvox reticuliferus]